ncbi:reverse transcriptase domain-containing protein [Fusicatenibacter saccharivorans]|uniref:reverse transcriptase domain-containing protein n=1 Tax=Fusicatenibacter saccharivorans TaxID=1150298 RepID=UPI003F923967
MTIRNVYYEITSFHTLMVADTHVSKGKRENTERLRFYDNREGNLEEISTLLRAGKVPKVEYHSFYIYVPKVRKVIFIDYWSKVVQRAIYDVLNPKICRTFIEHTYACVKGRGQLAAMEQLYTWMRETRTSGTEWYYYKFDVAKFFYRIDHEILMDICRKKIDDSRTVDLLGYYINNDAVPFGMPLDANQLTITEEQMLYDLGIPIGGGLSHMLGNMYLDPLDQFCKRVLGIKRYIRYMDDIIILDNDKERLKEYGRRMTQFLEERLHLNFNNKTALRPVRVGCEFVGFVIYNDHVILRKSTTLRMKRTLRKTRQDYHDNLITFKEANATMQSYLAMLSHVDCKKFKEKLLDEFVLTHADDNGEEQIINVIETGGIGALDYETMYC